MDLVNYEDIVVDERDGECEDVALLPSVIFPRFKARNRSFHRAILNKTAANTNALYRETLVYGNSYKFLDDSKRWSKYNWKIFLPFAPRSK